MKKVGKSKIAEALGASRVVEVGPKTIGGPLDLLALREEFARSSLRHADSGDLP
jgi:hypothetical protein